MRTSASLAAFTTLASLASLVSLASPALAEESPAKRERDAAPVDGGLPSAPALAPAREPAEDAAAPVPPPPTAPRVSPSAPARQPAPAPRVVWHPNTPLLATGLSLLVVGYGPNFVAALPSAYNGVFRGAAEVFSLGKVCAGSSSTGTFCQQYGAVQLFIPIFGPFLFAEHHPRDTVLNERGRPLSPTAKGLLYTSAGLQAAAIGALVASVWLGESTVARRKADTGPALLVAPLSVPGSAGLELGVQRW